jgi:hypothetical protein
MNRYLRVPSMPSDRNRRRESSHELREEALYPVSRFDYCLAVSLVTGVLGHTESLPVGTGRRALMSLALTPTPYATVTACNEDQQVDGLLQSQ